MNYIDTNNLDSDFKPLGRVDYSAKPGQHFFLFTRDNDFYILEKDPAKPMVLPDRVIETDEPGYNLGQFELPLKALPWLIDTIENKFWKKASEGGLPGDVLHVDAVIEGEDLRIRFSPNCGAEGVQGFTLENYSRQGKILNWQEMQIPYTLLREDGMLQKFKDICKKFGMTVN
jgi:hypothetical protein